MGVRDTQRLGNNYMSAYKCMYISLIHEHRYHARSLVIASRNIAKFSVPSFPMFLLTGQIAVSEHTTKNQPFGL